MSGALQAVFQNHRSFGPAPGQEEFIVSGTYSWVAPTGVTKVSAFAVSGGDGGAAKILNCCTGSYQGVSGPGGGIAYLNNYTVTPGNSYTVVVGAGGAGSTSSTRNRAGSSSFVSTAVLRSGNSCVGGVGTAFYGGGSGNNCSGARRGAGGGGTGGFASCSGGVGAAGGCSGTAGSSGGGGGGASGFNSTGNIGGGGGGGGIGLLGQGSNGARGTEFGGGGGGGSGGASGSTAGASNGGNGGAYGGGGGSSLGNVGGASGGAGGGGAIRIIWPGCSRSFPSTCTGNL